MGILGKVAGQTCVLREPESLEKNRYRGGKVTKSLNRFGRLLSIREVASLQQGAAVYKPPAD
jgi:hypothetical protein